MLPLAAAVVAVPAAEECGQRGALSRGQAAAGGAVQE